MLDDSGGVVRGTLDVLILKALSWGPRHGYAIAEWITATDEHLLIEDGPLYTALHRLEKKGSLAGERGLSGNNRRAKFYTLSPSGRRQLRAEVSAWERYARAVSRAGHHVALDRLTTDRCDAPCGSSSGGGTSSPRSTTRSPSTSRCACVGSSTTASPHEARRRAIQQFGNVGGVRDDCITLDGRDRGGGAAGAAGGTHRSVDRDARRGLIWRCRCDSKALTRLLR